MKKQALCSLLVVSFLILAPLLLGVHAQSNKEADHTQHAEVLKSLQVDFDDIDLSTEQAEKAAKQAIKRITSDGIQDRLTKLFQKTKTSECRAKIAQHFGYFLNAVGKETAMPFADVRFTNECPEPVYVDWENLPEGMHIGHIQNRTYQPPRNESEYIDDPAELRLLYGILTHDDPAAAIRLLEALYADGNIFVIHVDGKESSDKAYHQLVQYAASRDYVHVLDHRVRVNWGGFSMVNATMQILRYVFAVDEPRRSPLVFHKFVHMASTSYPLASNSEIRHELASYPLNANFMHIIMKPTRPSASVWHYFVECDDALHRIYRLPPLNNDTAGMELYTSSQWFIISREFAQYLAEAKPGTFVHQYLEYVEHVVVADETFFGTVLRHTSYCTKHHNRNFLHLQFDRWESDLPADQRDERKCMMPDPDHCGRSPTTMTVDYADILELSTDLFARKFLDPVDTQVKDIVDRWRDKREKALHAQKNGSNSISRHAGLDFEGHGVLIVAKDSAHDEVPLCLGLGPSGNKLKLVPCFYDWVVPTLADNWETGAVIIEETLPNNRWEISPCTTDGEAKRINTGEVQVTPGNYSVTGPRCMLKQMDGVRAGRCFDGDSGSTQPGGEVQVFPCVQRWVQFLSFGDGRLAPKGSMFFSIPSHIVKQIHNMGHKQIPYMCLGVYGRGNKDEVEWDEMEDKDEDATGDNDEAATDEPVEWEPLSEWENEEIVSTQCTNVGAVVEWLFVPYIVEDVPAAEDSTKSANKTEARSTDKATSSSDNTDGDGGKAQKDEL